MITKTYSRGISCLFYGVVVVVMACSIVVCLQHSRRLSLATRINCIDISSTGTHLAVSYQHPAKIVIWSLTDTKGRPDRTLQFEGPIISIKYSPNGDLLAVATESQVEAIDMVTLARHVITSELDAPIRCIGWSADGDWLAIGCDDGCVALRRKDGKSDAVIQRSHQGRVNCVVPVPTNDAILSGSRDGSLILTPMKLGAPWTLVNVAPMFIEDVGIYCDDIVMTTCDPFGNRQSLKQLSTSSDPARRKAISKEVDGITNISVACKNRLFAAALTDRRIVTMEVGSLNVVRSIQTELSTIDGIALSADGSKVATFSRLAGGENIIQVWNVENGVKVWYRNE